MLGAGKGSGPPQPLAVGAQPQLSEEEARQLAALSLKAGDATSATRYKDLADRLYAEKHPVEVPVHQRIQQSHAHIQFLEEKLSSALTKLEKWQQDVADQVRFVESIREDLETADKVYKSNVQELQAQAAPPKPEVPAHSAEAPKAQLKLSELVGDGFNLAELINLDELVADVSVEQELDSSDMEEINARKQQLGDHIQRAAKELLGPLVKQAAEARTAHEEHMRRLVAKKRRTGEAGGVPSAAPGGADGPGAEAAPPQAASAEGAEVASKPLPSASGPAAAPADDVRKRADAVLSNHRPPAAGVAGGKGA